MASSYEKVTIQQLQDAKEQLENSIMKATIDALQEFQKAVKLTPSDINIVLVDTRNIGSKFITHNVVMVEAGRNVFPKF